jgi:hypothetical protein
MRRMQNQNRYDPRQNLDKIRIELHADGLASSFARATKSPVGSSAPSSALPLCPKPGKAPKIPWTIHRPALAKASTVEVYQVMLNRPVVSPGFEWERKNNR